MVTLETDGLFTDAIYLIITNLLTLKDRKIQQLVINNKIHRYFFRIKQLKHKYLNTQSTHTVHLPEKTQLNPDHCFQVII